MYEKRFGKRNNIAAELFARDTRRNYRIDSDLADTSKLMKHMNFIVDNTYFYTKTGILKQQKDCHWEPTVHLNALI